MFRKIRENAVHSKVMIITSFVYTFFPQSKLKWFSLFP